MELVKEIREPKLINPRIQLLYSVPKAGKTTIVSHLINHLICELEPNGADYIKGRIQEVNKAQEFNDFLKTLEAEPGFICDYLIIDTVTKLDEWSEYVGTYNYMRKPQGKKFNRVGEKEGGELILHTDVRFESVHSLGQGYGYQHSREVMTSWYDRLENLIQEKKINYIILLAHVKDKYIESRNGDTIEIIDINLTGKVKSIFAARVSAVGHVYREKNKCYISYDNDHNKVACGGRCKHLQGSILISEKLESGEIKTYWDKIYLEKQINN